ncbi:kinesin-like protein KIF22 [Anser cygnoides]|uniref:kinesin-like protein KIF22 n=1 Tax=Anser cygnoides TaxID=8845 RepID=UPI0034D249AB
MNWDPSQYELGPPAPSQYKLGPFPHKLGTVPVETGPTPSTNWDPQPNPNTNWNCPSRNWAHSQYKLGPSAQSQYKLGAVPVQTGPFPVRTGRVWLRPAPVARQPPPPPLFPPLCPPLPGNRRHFVPSPSRVAKQPPPFRPAPPGCPHCACAPPRLPLAAAARLQTVGRERWRRRLRPVCVRLRPGPPGEEPCLLPLDSHTLELREEPPSAPSRYRFDAIYGAASSTAAVYEGSVRPLLSHLLAGRDVTVLAYGPSGSGKTHTMLGSEGEPGLVQRALEDVLEAVGDSRRVTVACMEVYCEEIRDLLCLGAPPRASSRPRGPPRGAGPHPPPLGPPPAPALLAASLGARRRAAPTLLNASSSRGHLVLWVRCDPPGPPGTRGCPPPPP